jgi:hypothetical protein
MKRILVILLAFLIIANACTKDDVEYTPDCSITKTFAADANPVIQTYCVTSGCHASGNGNGPGALTTYNEIYNARTSVRAAIADGSMPQNSSLSNTQKDAIICWIDSGAPNN